MRKLFLTALAVALASPALATSSVSPSANATANVLTDISAVKNQDLQFGNCTQNDPAKTVNVADTTNAAQFTVSGAANAGYTITLPANGTVTMITGGGGANRTIAVDNFASSPAATGNLGAGGSQVVYVGATRAAISATQVQGAYTGSFTVTFTYQ